MNIACIGGGVASLLFSILVVKRGIAEKVDIYEQLEEKMNSGWGLILNTSLLTSLKEVDESIYLKVNSLSQAWDSIEVRRTSERELIGNQPGRSIWRYDLIRILRHEAERIGINLQYGQRVASSDIKANYDLVVCGDGSASLHREALKNNLSVTECESQNRFIWLACNKRFSKMIFDFQPTDHGPVWVHAYPFSDSLSTFVVECSIATYQSWGYGQSNIETDVRNIESIFENILDGNKLRWLQNHPKQWRTFKQITTTHVNSDDNVVLMGDAANTAHFSIGCGTKLAVDDAIALNRSLGEHTNLLSALKAFGENRKAQTLDIQAVALRSMRWFENADSLMSVPFDNFIRSFMFRSFEPRKISPRDMVSI